MNVRNTVARCDCGLLRRENVIVQAVLGEGQSATRFASEFVGGINHINYNQDNRLNAFAGTSKQYIPAYDQSQYYLDECVSQNIIDCMQGWFDD